MRILLAEDSVLLRDGLAMLLERAGHEIVEVAGDADAMRATLLGRRAGELPDLLISDVRMPPDHSDDGLRAAVAVRAAHPRLPILLLSQWPATDALHQLLASVRLDPDAGGVGYLLKDRVAHVRDFLASVQAVAAGGVVVDREVIGALVGDRAAGLAELTPRELDVLRHVSEGATNPQIAQRLHLSEGAVVKHVSAIFDKLGLGHSEGNRRVLAVLAYLERRA